MEGEFTCLGGNTEKYITFSVSIKKTLQELIKRKKKSQKLCLNISLLSNRVNNIPEVINKTKCKYQHDNEQCKNFKIEYKDSDCFLQHTNFNNDLIE